MRVRDFDYQLPPERISQHPLEDRADARMLVLDRASGTWEDRRFRDFPDYLRAGDCLTLNNTKVIPARLFGHRAGVHATTSKTHVRGLVEVLLLRKVADLPLRWGALVRPGRKLRVGERIQFPGGLEAEIIEHGKLGLRVLRFESEDDFYQALQRIGHTPLPPYIKRSDQSEDRERYQTVYARQPGAVAAPTAGLHFTPAMLDQLERQRVGRAEITLHVGLGTFQPIAAEEVEEHELHAEPFEVSEQAARQLNEAGRVVAVGTTTVRTIEHVIRAGGGSFRACSGDTELFIYPGFEFKAVDLMLTNFHLPQSTLLMLVSAFAGRELTLDAYAHAVREGYRFYSYGDCMLIV